MTEKIFEWLAEKFGEEFKKRFPIVLVLAIFLSILLMLGAQKGEYMSALLGLINLPLSALAATEWFLAQKVYVIISALIFMLGGHFILKRFADFYFRYVCELPTHKTKIESMFLDQVKIRVGHSLLSELREAEAELNRRRSSVTRCVKAYESSALFGLALLFAQFWGNALDLVIGVLLLIFSMIALDRAVRLFLAKVTPWHAKVEALSIINPASPVAEP